MCGRFVITSPPEALRQLFGYREQPNMPQRHNVAPTQPVPVVIVNNGERRFCLMRWGLLPSWVKDPRKFTLLINARSDTLLEKPAFKNAVRRRRCLIPADGWYEWQDQGTRKQPFFIYPRDGRPIAFAALAETWAGPNGEELDTVAIITTTASHDLAPLHARAPVTIADDYFERWLDCRSEHPDDVADALALLLPPSEGQFGWHPISIEVNRVANDHPGLMAPLTAEQAATQAPPEVKAPRPRAKPERPDEGQGSLF